MNEILSQFLKNFESESFNLFFSEFKAKSENEKIRELMMWP